MAEFEELDCACAGLLGEDNPNIDPKSIDVLVGVICELHHEKKILDDRECKTICYSGARHYMCYFELTFALLAKPHEKVRTAIKVLKKAKDPVIDKLQIPQFLNVCVDLHQLLNHEDVEEMKRRQDLKLKDRIMHVVCMKDLAAVKDLADVMGTYGFSDEKDWLLVYVKLHEEGVLTDKDVQNLKKMITPFLQRMWRLFRSKDPDALRKADDIFRRNANLQTLFPVLADIQKSQYLSDEEYSTLFDDHATSLPDLMKMAIAKDRDTSKGIAAVLHEHGRDYHAPSKAVTVLSEFVAEEWLSVGEGRNMIDAMMHGREWISTWSHAAAAKTSQVSKQMAKILDAHGFTKEAAVVRKRENVGDPMPLPQPEHKAFGAPMPPPRPGSRNPSRIPPEPSDSDEIRRIIDNAVKNGAVDIKVVKCVFLGPPEAGKTQLRRALVENYTKSQESTPASTQATPVIDLLVAGSKKWEHFSFRHMSTFSRSRVSNKNTASEDKHNARKFNSTQSDQEPIAEEITGSISLESPHKESANMEANEPESNLETFQRLYEAIRHNVLKESGTSTMDNLEAIRLIYVVDSGGQPSFVDFHSVTATFPASYLLVYNMEQGLDCKPQYTLRKKIDTKVLPNNTQSNADMIKRSLLTVHHLKSKFSDRNKQIKALLMEKFCQCDEPPIFIVGTHKDQATVKNDCERLKRLYGNIPLMRQVVHRRFVDSLSEGCEGIKELRETMSDKGSLCSFRLPLSWFHLHLMAMSLESEEIPNRNLQVQSYGDLCKMCMKSGLVESEEEFNAMIVVLHSLGVFSCPDFELRGGPGDSIDKEDIIFLSPSVLYEYVTALMEIPFRNLLTTAHTPLLLRLQETGELKSEALTELGIPEILGSCKDFHDRLIAWLVNWGLAAKMDGEERYFIPSVLPLKSKDFLSACTEMTFNPFPLSICFLEDSSDNFTFHYLPEGFFPYFVVNLVKNGYTLQTNQEEEQNFSRCRDAAFLSKRSTSTINPMNNFNIWVIDEATHLSVYMSPAGGSSAPSAHQEAGAVLADLKDIAEKTNRSLYYRSNDNIAICCTCPCKTIEGAAKGVNVKNSHLAQVTYDHKSNRAKIFCLDQGRSRRWELHVTKKEDETMLDIMKGFHGIAQAVSGNPPGPSTSGKRSPNQDTDRQTQKRTQFSNVSVDNVIQIMTREKLTEGVKKMLTDHCTHILCDDQHLINDDCRHRILALLANGHKIDAANQLIDYFRNNHDGSSLDKFCEFLTCQAHQAGSSANMTNLSEEIRKAMESALQR